jgi:hypothetical protein
MKLSHIGFQQVYGRVYERHQIFHLGGVLTGIYCGSTWMKISNLKKLNDAEGKRQYRVEISNRFAAVENFDDDVDISRAWENIRENIKILAKVSLVYYEMTQHTPWFDEGCSKPLHQTIQAKLQWLQNLS